MSTITIPRADYVQRADDEGRDFYAARTIHAAAELWAVDARGTRNYMEHGPDDGRVFVFAEYNADDDSVSMTDVHPDEDMEDLYPAEALPFTIVAAPFQVGDWISPTPVDGQYVYPIVKVDDSDGRVWISHRAPWTSYDGLITVEDYPNWKVVPAPTVTYTVTVSADHTTDDVRDHLRALGGPVTVSR